MYVATEIRPIGNLNKLIIIINIAAILPLSVLSNEAFEDNKGVEVVN
jgi:hypothetical protein